jgi:hypothetical protein
MPRNISMSKKYLPARSNEPSPSSHFFGGGNRNPGGGGPAGVAARRMVVEKNATVAGEGRRPDANCDVLSSVAADEPRASIINGFVLAIVGAESERSGYVVFGRYDVRLFEDEVGLGTGELRLANISMTATTLEGKGTLEMLSSGKVCRRQRQSDIQQ